jgi:small-conductance mechanosensitive channel
LEETYTVKEIRLLSTIFLDARGCVVQAPNLILNATVRNLWLFVFQ